MLLIYFDKVALFDHEVLETVEEAVAVTGIDAAVEQRHR